LRVIGVEYLKTSLTMLDGEVVVVGYDDIEVMIEDGKRRLIRTENLLKLMEYDLETDDHTP
jgi:hypothetical protein